jgi:hypothetical protein
MFRYTCVLLKCQTVLSVAKLLERWKYRNVWHRNIIRNCFHTTKNISQPLFRILFAKYFIAQNLTTRVPKILLSFDSFSTLIETVITIWFLWLRLQQKSIERAMDLTDGFTWEDLPTTDADTGHLTAAGWISLTMKYSRNAAIAFLCFHTVQSTIRILTNHETLFVAWYPFDWTVSPFYELVNISQVTIYKKEFLSIYSYSILNLTDGVNRHTFFFLSFFLYLFIYLFLPFWPLPFLIFYDTPQLQRFVR